jgi:hypothetical protein
MVDGLPMIKGDYGVRNGRYAVKVTEIEHPVTFGQKPDERGFMSPQFRERPTTASPTESTSQRDTP